MTLDEMYQSVNRIKRAEILDAYEAGRDYAKNGANERNCHFSNFATPERTKAWEAGRDGVQYDFTSEVR